MALPRSFQRGASRSGGLGRVAGLEIGPASLRVVDRSDGTTRTGELAVPRSVLDDGRVLDVDGLGAAIRELWQLADIRARDVVVGLANQDVVSRQLEMPELSDADLASALRFELADLVPFPVADAVVRFRRIDTAVADGAPMPTVRVLAVAALASGAADHLAAARAAGLRVRTLDLAPAALIRATAAVAPTEGVEAVVAVSADGFSVAIHERGIAHFTRSIATRASASAPSDLEAELVFIEEYRQRSSGGGTGLATAEQRLGPVVEAIRGTLEYSTSQPGARPIDRVTICGDELLTATAQQLAQVLPCPVSMIDPLALLDDELGGRPGDSSRFATAFGLTLAGDDGAHGPRSLDLVPESSTGRGRALAIRGGIAALTTAVVLAGASVALGPDASGAAADADAAEARLSVERRQLSAEADDLAAAAELQRIDRQIARLDTLSIDWAGLVDSVVSRAPAGTTIISISGDAPTVARSGRKVPGTIEIVATTTSTTAISDWMQAIDAIDGVSEPWLDSASGGGTRGGGETTFTLTAVVARPEADR